MKASLVLVVVAMGIVSALLGSVAASGHDDVAWGARRRASISRSNFYRAPSPGYEYRFMRSEARSAAGYNRLFSF